MKIINWNCNMAFRKKAGMILRYNPDIIVVPECEHPDKIKFDPSLPQPSGQLWFGSNQHKGLGIFTFNGYQLKTGPNYQQDLKIIAPVTVTRNDKKFSLFAIWANNPEDPDGQYVEQVWKAIHHYKRKIRKQQTILIGDFNSNTIWDRKYRIGNHSHVVSRLAKKGIHSCYHSYVNQEHGKEKDPTFYLYKRKDKPYHLDYCFASMDLLSQIQSIEIGDYDTWKPFSDHVPLIVTFNPSL
ncbi:MAG TPA: hypothetical protein PLZ10_13305 [Chitinophagaceae bacterium]|nr:hypothetical protein [Chitinophagaceae bacterium]